MIANRVGARVVAWRPNDRFKRRSGAGLLTVLLTCAVVGLCMAGIAPVHAREGSRGVATNDARDPGDPILAVVSLQKQRITIYDAQGWVWRAPVSSGQKGRETPSGVFSVLEKDADHHSNLYDDAFMPHMQRLTWSGIALHGGPLPGHAASHGCVRMPYDFAEQLFDATRLGLRVIVAPGDAAPVDVSHPLLLRPKPGVGELVVARKAAMADATAKYDQARHAAGSAYREAMAAMVPVRVAENQMRRAEAQRAAAETALATSTSDEARQAAEDAKAQATAAITDLQAQLETARAELQKKLDARDSARDAVAAAEAAHNAAADAVKQAARELEPVSVMISRKTQRLYVRQGFQPVFDAPITIADPDRSLGSYVFTAMERSGADDSLRWTVVALEGPRGNADVRPGASAAQSNRGPVQASAPADEAKAALDRITIPQEVLDRIAGATPRASLIVSDEAPSPETSKGTDFIVVLSDQPQGGIKFRKRTSPQEYSYVGARYRSPAWGMPYGPRGFFSW